MPLAFSWSSADGTLGLPATSGGTSEVSWTLPGAFGSYTATVSVSNGVTAPSSFVFTVNAVDVETDPDHCGSIHHSCQGGDCVAGACQPVVLASGHFGWEIAVDDQNVYWVEGSGDPDPVAAAGGVYSVSKSGGPVTTLASGRVLTTGLAVNGGQVFFSDQGTYGGYVPQSKVSVTTTGGGDEIADLISGVHHPTFLDADESYVYFASYGDSQLMRIARSGGPAEVLAPIPNVLFVRVAGAYVYTESDSGSFAGVDTVFQVPKVPGAGEPIPLATGQVRPHGLEVNATHVYWGTWDSTIKRTPIGGGDVTTLLVDDAWVSDLVVDATTIYWTSNNGWAVKAMPIDGGPVRLLASGQVSPMAIAQDDKCIYWTATGSGTIMKLAK